jgi:uncharacterized membrane protein YdjX (TVP38/TMEM64 family)
MQMTLGMLLFCLAVALAGVALLLLALRGLLQSVRSRRQTNGYLWAAGLIFTVGLLAIDTVVLWCLINYAAGLTGVPRRTFVWTTGLGILPLTAISVLFGSQALQWPVYVWILVGLTILLFLAAMRWARRAIAGTRRTSDTRPNKSAYRSGPTP